MKKLIKKSFYLSFLLISLLANSQTIINSYAHEVVGGGGGAVPVLESTSQTELTTVTTVAAPAPSGIVDDDVIIAIIAMDSGSDHSITAPDVDWTRETGLDNQANGNETAVFWLVADSESGSYTFTWTGAEKGTIVLMRWSGVDTVNPINTIGTKINGTLTAGEDEDLAGVTSVIDNTAVVSYLSTDRGYTMNGLETINGGTGWSQVVQGDGWGGSGGVGFALLTKEMASSGDSGQATYGDYDSSQDFNTQAFTIKSE